MISILDNRQLVFSAAITLMAALTTSCALESAPNSEGAQSSAPAREVNSVSPRRGIFYSEPREAVALITAASSRGDRDFFSNEWRDYRKELGNNVLENDLERIRIASMLAEEAQLYEATSCDDCKDFMILLAGSKDAAHRQQAAAGLRTAFGSEALSFLFGLAMDQDKDVSAAALRSIHWKVTSPLVSASGLRIADASQIKRNIEKLCAEPELPKDSVLKCREIVEATRAAR